MLKTFDWTGILAHGIMKIRDGLFEVVLPGSLKLMKTFSQDRKACCIECACICVASGGGT
jgi:hypothetical protein